jgi:hypothetical protein
MALSLQQLEVTSFETTPAFDLSPNQAYTAPEPNCYSPLCIPTNLPDQCPDETTQTVVVIED